MGNQDGVLVAQQVQWVVVDVLYNVLEKWQEQWLQKTEAEVQTLA